MRFSCRDVAAFLLVGSSSLSFVSLGFGSSDSQPWPLLALLVIFLFIPLCFKSVKSVLVASLIAFTGIPLNLFLNSSTPTSILRFIASLAIFSLSYVASISCFRARANIYLFLRIFNLLSILFAALQLIFPSLLGILSVNRTTLESGIHSRGYPSFFPEPSLFGFYLLICSIIYICQYRHKSSFKVLIALNFLAALVLSQSTIAIMMFFALILSIFLDPLIHRLFLCRIPFRSLLLIFLMLSIAASLVAVVLALFSNNTRFGFLLSSIVSNPLLPFYVDASSNQRLYHVIAPFIVSFQNSMLPFTFDGMNAVGGSSFPDFINDFFWYKKGGRTMNLIGELTLSLGLLGLLSTFLYLSAPLRALLRRGKYVLCALVPLILINALPLAFPMVGILLASLSCPPDRL